MHQGLNANECEWLLTVCDPVPGRYQELPRHESTLTRAVAAQQDAAACAEAALAVEKVIEQPLIVLSNESIVMPRLPRLISLDEVNG